MRLSSRLLALLLGVLTSCVPKQGYLDVTVNLGAGVKSTCVKVVLVADTSTGQVKKETKPMKLTGTSLHVAVYRDALPETVSIQALGFSNDACDVRTVPTEESTLDAATFAQTPTAVTLQLVRGAATDGDGDGFSPPVDCNDADPLVKPGVVELCNDAVDNDCKDGIDCADPSCAAMSCGAGATCSGQACHENLCSDGIDGDRDGLTDCADPDCDMVACGTGTGARCTASACVEQTCTDNVDNDGDGMKDCADLDCAGVACGVGGMCTAGTCREPVETVCNDGLDGDNDGMVDCADTDCATRGCEDGNRCTMGETCTALNACTGGTAVTCSMPPGACYSAVGVCSPGTGQCVYAPASSSTVCSDGNACNTGLCNGSGTCATTPRVCPAPPSGCFMAGVCQASLDGGCSYAVNAGAGCTDGNACTTGDSCGADGGCVSGTLTTCTPGECQTFTAGNCDGTGACIFGSKSAGTACTGGACNASGACVPAPDGGFLYAPDNFVPGNHPPSGAVVITCPLVFVSGPDAGFGTLCNGMTTTPNIGIATGSDAGELTVLSMASLTITDAGSLTLYGTRPVVFAVFGDATVNGQVLANSSRAAARLGPGASGATTCAARRGGNGILTGGKGSGGGGAGFFTLGGEGGGGNGSAGTGGDGGVGDVNGDVPLLVGCPGGAGKTDTGTVEGGPGGGAVQFSVSGTLTVNAIVTTSGHGGNAGSGGGDPGGGGGGSGGALVLQAQRLVIQGGAKLTANGGAGGGGAQGGTAQVGGDGSISSATPASGGNNESGGGAGGDGAAGATLPQAGVTAGKGGGGGGGASGRVFLKHVDTGVSCAVSGSAVISPAPKRVNCP